MQQSSTVDPYNKDLYIDKKKVSTFLNYQYIQYKGKSICWNPIDLFLAGCRLYLHPSPMKLVLATVNPTLNCCTRYPLLLTEAVWIQSWYRTFTYDRWHGELNPRPQEQVQCHKHSTTSVAIFFQFRALRIIFVGHMQNPLQVWIYFWGLKSTLAHDLYLQRGQLKPCPVQNSLIS